MAEDTELQAGTAWMTITPPTGVELSGYGFYLNRKSQSVRRHLYAQALVLEQADTRIALIAADLIAVSAEITARTRAAVAALADIPADNVLIACSHTHSGPATIFIRGCGEVDEAYTAMLPRYFASLVATAMEELEPVWIAAGSARLDGLAHNRVDPDGVVDTAVQALEINGANAGWHHALFSFGCHPVTTLPDDPEIGGDFPVHARAFLQRCPDYRQTLFLQGSCGDINPVMAHAENLGAQVCAGQMLAGAALIAMAQAEEVENLRPCRCRLQTIELPLDIPTREEMERRRDDNRALLSERDPDSPEGRTARFWVEATESLLRARKRRADSGPVVPPAVSCELQAIQIGDVVILAHPTELFAEFGLEIKARSPFPHTLVVGYANGFLGYIPNEAEFARKGYAADTVPYMLDMFPYAPDVGRIFVEECNRFLEEMRQTS
jgi:hypothetical protein